MNVRKVRIALLRLCSVPAVLLAVFVRPRWVIGSGAAIGIELAGYFFLLAGLGMRIWSILYIGGRKSHELVVEGPYSICRNPLYIGTFLVGIGAGLCFENVPLLVFVLAVFVPVHVIAARLEERHLESLFPREYPLYRDRVPRFWPRLRGFHAGDTLTISVHVIRRVVVDTAGILLIPEVEDLLEVLHEGGVLPVLWRFP